MPASTAAPQFATFKRDTEFAHSEYGFSVYAATNFTLLAEDITPMNPRLGAFTASIAELYQEFEILGCVAEYRPLSGNALNSTNTALGKVAGASNYNANAPLYASMREMEAQEFSVACAPSERMWIPFECARRDTPFPEFFADTGANQLPNDTVTKLVDDRRLDNLGVFQIAVEGCQASGYITGEVWFHWHLRLLKPRLWNYPLGNGNVNFNKYSTSVTKVSPNWVSGLDRLSYSSGSTGMDFAADPTVNGRFWLVDGGQPITSGNWMIEANHVYGSGSCVGAAPTVDGNYVGATIASGTAQDCVATSFGVANGSNLLWRIFLTIKGPGGLTAGGVTFSYTTPGGTSFKGNIRATRLPEDFFSSQ
uniref:Capsid protein n=1 Tax=Riboviria sp. TaxID=2585031 RepID=A0A514D0H6_9VIRU|nr:MAG: hypothetical protein H3BulkLitter161620_000001 [Riboviria sp.]